MCDGFSENCDTNVRCKQEVGLDCEWVSRNLFKSVNL